MRALLRVCVVSFPVFTLAPAAQAQKKADIPPKDPAAALQRLLETKDVDAAPFHLPLPLSEALKKIDNAFGAGSGPTRLDSAALGPDDQRIAKSLVQLDKKRKRLRAIEAFDNLLGQVRNALNVDVNLGIRGDKLVVTTGPLAAYDATYDVGDLVAEAQHLAKGMRELAKMSLGKGVADDTFLTLLVALSQPRPFESFRLVNGKSLIAHATPVKQREIGDLLQSLRRVADVAVVMDAQLFEVDRVFFVQHAAPLFLDDKTKAGRSIAIVGSGLRDKLTKLKPIALGVDHKLRGGRPGLVLSMKQALETMKSVPPPIDADLPVKAKDEPQTVIVGALIDAVVNVTPDRRFIDLEIRQKITEMGGPRRFGDPEFGFEEAEQPILRRVSLASGIRIPDGLAILVHIPFRPPHAPDRVWLLLAQPRIFIQEEEDAIRKAEEKRP